MSGRLNKNVCSTFDFGARRSAQMGSKMNHTVAIVIVVAVCTFLTRLIPFLCFGGKKETPKTVQFLGNVLPPAIMAALVVYCLRNVNIWEGSRGIPQLLGVCITAGLHLWKKNILISIAGGTICYMTMIQLVF